MKLFMGSFEGYGSNGLASRIVFITVLGKENVVKQLRDKTKQARPVELCHNREVIFLRLHV